MIHRPKTADSPHNQNHIFIPTCWVEIKEELIVWQNVMEFVSFVFWWNSNASLMWWKRLQMLSLSVRRRIKTPMMMFNQDVLLMLISVCLWMDHKWGGFMFVWRLVGASWPHVTCLALNVFLSQHYKLKIQLFWSFYRHERREELLWNKIRAFLLIYLWSLNIFHSTL